MAKPTMNQELLSKLKSSLPKLSPSASVDPTPAADTAEIPSGTPPSPPAPPPSVQAPARPTRLAMTISLYESDLKRIDEIKDFMKQRGYRNLSDSEALRLACRGVEMREHLIALYQSMQNQDGRRKPVEI